MTDIRRTVRINDREQAELELYKAMFHSESDSEAYKSAVSWVLNYIKNVTNTFFPPNYDVVLIKKKKTQPLDRKIWKQ